MAAPVTASERDLRALAAIVTDDWADLPAGEGLPPSLLDDLLGLIPSDFLTFMGIDSGRQENWFGYDVPVDDYDILGDASPEEFWDNYWASDSCCYPDRTGDLRSVTKISDFYSARQWHSTGMYRDTVRLAGVEHQLALCLPAGPGRLAGPGQTVRLLFSRGPRLDFSERDRAVLTLLRPHLHRAYIDAERRPRRHASANPPAAGIAAPGCRRAHHLPDRPAARRVGRNGAHPPAEHLRQAPGVEPNGRSQPRVSRPRDHVTANTALSEMNASLGANVGATRVNDFPRQADWCGPGMAPGGQGSVMSRASSARCCGVRWRRRRRADTVTSPL
jgi:hypothetical protein